MHIAVLSDAFLKEEFVSKKIPAQVECTFADSLRSLQMIEADAYFDLLFSMDPERILQLQQLVHKPLFVNAVAYTAHDIRLPVIRINAWPSFLQREFLEIAVTGEKQDKSVEEIFKKLQWKYHIVPDIPGFITARIVASIINEAYFTLGDQVSTKTDIDIAMKLGTNYPYGPFEWSEKIGLGKVAELLRQLYKNDHRYEIAPVLELELWKETGSGKKLS